MFYVECQVLGNSPFSGCQNNTIRHNCNEGAWEQGVEVTGGWRKLHNEGLQNLYSSPIRTMQSMKMRWAGHVARMRDKRNAYRAFGGKARRKETIRKTKT
jgi:hypothetical protein